MAKTKVNQVRRLEGQQFKNVVVLEFKGTVKGRSQWLVRCECGTEFITNSNRLRQSVRSLPCGNLRAHNTIPRAEQKEFKHLFNSYRSALVRCYNPKNKDYPNYGGRGVEVEEYLKNYWNFKDWALDSGWEKDLTLDRIDPNRGYERSNLRWADPQLQALNKRDSTRDDVGVYKVGNKYRAVVKRIGVSKFIGSFDTKEEAILQRKKYIEENDIRTGKK
ncbi:hypothetical protein OIT44_03860 [Weissella ceti]|uniref:AP2 domain protein n=1 Tax=Weissella ceti TaxID=759620 RepID=A0ABT3E474_9LACO|nr:hypothetical protein [Weissella ceti]MCW0953209.1 hypothetical protein [Weissella ceti]QVK12726.1 hypothetical protein KHQ31_03620 [Weissella ceti]